MATLLVIVPDSLSVLAQKGEITPRYYNPGDVFDKVHILLTNGDSPDPAVIQPMVGNAALRLHNLPYNRKLFLKTAGWRPRLLRGWAATAVDLAREIKPVLVRCHGNGLNAFAASEIKRVLGIPYVVSLHGNPDVDYFRGRLAKTWQEKLIGRAIESAEIVSIKNADMVLPVYSPIVPYLEKHGVRRYEVVYNAVGHSVEPKRSYDIDSTAVKVVCVGRQQTGQKDQTPIIEAVARMPNVRLTLIGDGDLHERLKARASDLGARCRVRFIPSIPNADVLREIAAADIFAYSSINWEISKATIEAALCGLPIILNDRSGAPADELNGGWLKMVENTSSSYEEGLRSLIENDYERAKLGTAARARAERHWKPEMIEARVGAIYRSLAAA